MMFEKDILNMKLDRKKMNRFQSTNNVSILQNNLGNVLQEKMGKTPLGINLEIPGQKQIIKKHQFGSSTHLFMKNKGFSSDNTK